MKKDDTPLTEDYQALNNNASNEHFDVIISGGGLSGCLSALSLSLLRDHKNTPLKIAIIEANVIEIDSNKSFDERVLALSHGSVNYLKSLHVWHDICDNAQAIDNIHISDRGYYGKARLYAKNHQVEALGYVAAMSTIGAALVKKVKQQSHISWYSPDVIESITWQKAQVNLTLKSQQTLTAKLLLACDGAQSVCRQFANISVKKHDYQQSALIANVEMAQHHNNIAYERFTEFGPIAMLPLSAMPATNQQTSGRCSLVWTLTPEQALKLKTLTDKEFSSSLFNAFGSWLGNVKHVGKRVIFPLQLVQATEQIYHRMALIGNASHTIHPIAGQGFNLGLRDVVQITEQVQTSLANRQDIGNFSSLLNYANAREQDQKNIIGLTDSLVTLFSNQHSPLVFGRNIALKVLNYVHPLKKVLVKKTMGY